MLVAKKLSQKIMLSTFEKKSKEEAFEAMASAIEDYITENTQIEFDWQAQHIQNGSSDTSIKAKGKITKLKIEFNEFLNNKSTTPEEALNSFSKDIIASFKKAEYNVTDTGFVMNNSGTFALSSNINELKIIPNKASNRNEAFEQMADQIIKWALKLEAKGPCQGIRAINYNGNASNGILR